MKHSILVQIFIKKLVPSLPAKSFSENPVSISAIKSSILTLPTTAHAIERINILQLQDFSKLLWQRVSFNFINEPTENYEKKM